MKQLALVLSLLLLLSLTSGAFAVDQKQVQNAKHETLIPVAKDLQAKQGPSATILGETNIFEEDFEGDLSDWFLDGGYGSVDGGTPAVSVHPALWEVSQVKAKSPTHSLFHPDEFDVSRSFAFSPAFVIPTEIGGDPVVSAKVSFQGNIDNPGYGDPTGATNNLADYFMVYAGLEDTQFSVVDVEGNKVYYSGYPEENSFQYLTSPTIDLTAAVAPVALDFKYLLINEENWDLARVDLIVDGVDKYVTVAQFDNTPEWADASVDISAYAGKTLKVRFSFLPDDGTAITGGGFWVDDIKVKDASGDLFMDDAEDGNAVMNAFGVSLQRLFYDYDAADAGAAWHLWDESALFNGTTDLFDLGITAGEKVWLAFRYIADGDNTQGEDASAGFFIDDIAVNAISGVPADAAISDLVVGYPRTPGFATPVAATVSNFGFEAQEIALWYKIDDGAAKPVPPRLSLPAFYDSTRIFNANLPAADSTLFTAYTMLTDDAVPENDAMSAMVYPDAPGTATFSNFNGTFATYTVSNRIVMFDPLAALAGVEKYDVKSVDVYMYGTADDVVNVKVATWTDDPTVPGEILADLDLNVPVGITPFTIDVNKTGLTQKLAVWFDFTASAKKAGPLLDTITPFTGNEIFLNAADGNWYYSARGTMAFVNAAYALPPTMLTTFEENFDAPVDLTFWTPNTSTLDDGTPVFAVTQEEDALKVVMNQKAFPDGQMYDWMYFNEYFDLTAAPMWSMKIKVMPGATYTKDGKATALTEIPFMGSPFTILKGTAGGDSLVRQHSNPTVKVPVDGEWHDVMFDWSTADTDPQYPNDFTNITRLLLETVTWPGTHQATFYIDDVKVGDAAVPPVPPLPQVFHASHPPAIDGKLDPIWKHAQWVRDYVTPGGTPAFNNAALSWRAMWDNDYLYLFITVIDDIFLSDTPNTWQGDSVELWLDGDNSKAAAYDGINDLGFGFKYLNDPANPLIFNNPGGEWYKGTTGHLYGASYVEGGVNLEVAVPMKNLTLTPVAGNLIGMDVDYNDNDLGGGRANKVKWFDATDNSWQYPNLMGTIQLAERTIYDYTDVWYTDAAPVIDGTPDDMSKFPTFELNQYMTEVAKLSNWDKDAKLQYQAVWDEKAVYYQVHITDDVLVQDGVYDHTDDGLELWFDGDNSRKTVYDGINDIGARFGYVPGGGLDSLMVFGWGGSGHYIWGPGTIDFASSPTADGVFLEFAVSMDTLGMKPVNGYMFAHELDYNDDDDGEGRDTKCKTHSIVDDTWINPSYMSSAKLMGGPGEPLPAEPEMLKIDMTAVPPVIDGAMDRMWENAVNYQMGTLINGAIDDWWDSYGNFRVLYDATNFYMFIEVHDDIINTEHGTDYERDSIELFLDGNNSKNPMGADPWAWPPTAYDADDTQLRFVFDTAPINSIGSYDVSTFEYAYLETETGWNFELLMPWAGQPFKGVDGLKIGLEVALNDNDGANREAITNWWSTGGEAWHDPSTFGTAQFTARKLNEKTTKYEWDRLLPIPFTAYPVKIDGQADYGWDSVAPVFSNMRMNNSGNKDYLVGPLDGQIEWKAAWDYNNLYLLIDVTDDIFLQEGSKSWQDDGVEIWFDGDASMKTAYTDANDLSFGLTYNPDTILDPITTWRGNPALTAEQLAQIGQAQVLTDHGFTVELSLPMSIIGVEAGDGSLIALEVDYNDSDTPGLDRDTKLKSYDPTDNSWQNPSLLGMARLVGSVVKSDVEENVEIVVDYELNQNYPNPFNPTTTIEFALPLSGKVKLAVYDILGREVMTLVDTKMEAGRHSATFDASRLSSGVYFYRLQTSERVFTKKMMLIK